MNTTDAFQEQKWMQLMEALKILQPGDTISTAFIQRKIRVSYDMGKEFLKKLHQEKKVESYQSWVGTSVNGVRKNGHEITLYRIPE